MEIKEIESRLVVLQKKVAAEIQDFRAITGLTPIAEIIKEEKGRLSSGMEGEIIFSVKVGFGGGHF